MPFNLTYEEMMQKRLGSEDTFKFRCRACGQCCKQRDDVVLTPYDVFRIARYFGRNPHDIIKRYCLVTSEVTFHMPAVMIKPQAPDQSCPFLRNKKCVVHKDKPMVCAVFPLARFYLPGDPEPSYFFNGGTAKCKSDQEVTVKDWLGPLYNEENNQACKFWSEFNLAVGPILMNCWSTLSEEAKLSVFNMSKLLLYHYDIRDPFLPQFEQNVLKLLSFLTSYLELETIPSWVAIQELTDAKRIADLLKAKAYGQYQKQWLESRNLHLWDKNTSNVGWFQPKEIFLQTDFLDRECMENLLSKADLELWESHFI